MLGPIYQINHVIDDKLRYHFTVIGFKFYIKCFYKDKKRGLSLDNPLMSCLINYLISNNLVELLVTSNTKSPSTKPNLSKNLDASSLLNTGYTPK